MQIIIIAFGSCVCRGAWCVHVHGYVCCNARVCVRVFIEKSLFWARVNRNYSGILHLQQHKTTWWNSEIFKRVTQRCRKNTKNKTIQTPPNCIQTMHKKLHQPPARAPVRRTLFSTKSGAKAFNFVQMCVELKRKEYSAYNLIIILSELHTTQIEMKIFGAFHWIMCRYLCLVRLSSYSIPVGFRYKWYQMELPATKCSPCRNNVVVMKSVLCCKVFAPTISQTYAVHL